MTPSLLGRGETGSTMKDGECSDSSLQWSPLLQGGGMAARRSGVGRCHNVFKTPPSFNYDIGRYLAVIMYTR